MGEEREFYMVIDDLETQMMTIKVGVQQLTRANVACSFRPLAASCWQQPRDEARGLTRSPATTAQVFDSGSDLDSSHAPLALPHNHTGV